MAGRAEHRRIFSGGSSTSGPLCGSIPTRGKSTALWGELPAAFRQCRDISAAEMMALDAVG